MQKFKRFLLVLTITLLCVIPTLYGVIYWFGGNIKLYLVSQISNQLAVEVKTGDIQFSILANFPKASLLFSDVVIFENYPGRKKELLKANEIYLSFNIWDIIDKKYTINEVVIKNGNANLFVDKKGRDNYTFIKEAPKNNPNDSISVHLKDIRIHNMKVVYEDLEVGLWLSSLINETTLGGDFYEEKFNLKWKGDFYFDTLQFGKINYIKKRRVSMNSALEVNVKESNFRFAKGDLTISGLPFNVEGNIKLLPKDKGTLFNMDITGKEMTIQSFLLLLPEENRKAVVDYKSEGDFYFNTQINGVLSAKENPHININFGISKASVYTSGISEGLQNLSCKGTFTNGSAKNAQTSKLIIENLKAKLGPNELNAVLQIENLNDPLLIAQLHGNIDLQKMTDFLQIEQIETLKGFAFADLYFAGRISDLKQKETALKTKSEGQMKLSGIELKLKDNPHSYRITNGQFGLHGNDFSVNDFAATADETNFLLNGTIKNFLPYLFLDKQHLLIDANLTSTNIDLEKVFFTSRNQERIDSSGFIFPENIELNLNLRIEKLKLYKFNASEVTGNLTLKNNILRSANLSLKAMKGQINIAGEINNRIKDRLLISCDASMQQLDINQLFYQCENFGQDMLTDKHLRGKLDTKIQFGSVWNSDFNCDLKKIVAQADITITNGEIMDYAPLMELSKFAEVNELKHLTFDKLTNTIQILDGKIIIPQMEVKNNALNLAISGTNTFPDNYLDYHIRAKLSDVIRKKRNTKINKEFEEEETQGGGIYIYLTMKGYLENLVISYDKLGVKKKIKESIHVEQQNIKDILKKEFQTEEDKKLKEEEKKQEEEINWEEDVPQ
jgi:hypothetical protein